MDSDTLKKRLAFIRSVVRKNPVAADGLLRDLEREIGKAQPAKAEWVQAEIPQSQYTRVKGTILGPDANH